MEKAVEDFKYYNNKVVQLNAEGRAARIGYILELPRQEGEDTQDMVKRYRERAEREGDAPVEKIRLIPRIDTIVFLEETYREKALPLRGAEFHVLQGHIASIMGGDYVIPGEDYYFHSPLGKG